jgi:D-lactate dehydrogenase (cytochrome)
MDLIIAKSEYENKNFWQIREEIPLAEKLLKNVIQHDVSLPLNNIENFIYQSSQSLKKYNKNILIVNFGHLGDNNLHFNVCINESLNKKQYENFKKNVNEIIFSNVKKFNGSISAEHGIGQLRKDELKKYKSLEEIQRMKKIKKIFDPKNIMNPGKVL